MCIKCKNPECENEPKKENIYCSLRCRNIYVNKYIRNYKKLKNTNEERRQKQKENYLKNPKKCKNCNTIISFEKKRLNYCNHSCAASSTNKFKLGIKTNISDIGLKNILDATKNRFKTDEYYDNPNKCKNCDSILMFQKRNRIFCDAKCKKIWVNKDKEEYEIYYLLSKFNFELKKYDDYFDFNIIRKYGWYKAKNHGDNMNGVSRDHKFSVKEGFRRLINPLLLAHPANCELITNRHNQSKYDGCSITIEELLDRIARFDLKYGKYYDTGIKIYIDLNELKTMYTK